MLLKWTKTELSNLPDSTIWFDEFITFNSKEFINARRLNGLEDVHVNGEGFYDANLDMFDVYMQIEGVMITPCAITNEDIYIPFEFDSNVLFSFIDNEDVDVYLVENDTVELAPVIFQLINLEVPLKAIKSGNIEYPKGDGWAIISEQDLIESKKNQIDPRLAKLKEFKFSDDD
ncbi:MAG: DUF177 domain-containing protein [Erysipelotrichaceae bacterium]|nr:DUF177 domain-containing protein [Bacillota bacterium]HCY07206.1 hypothetical protein [Erysipelotrichaceae bacterium]